MPLINRPRTAHRRLLWLALTVPAWALAQPAGPGPGAIYTCVDDRGRRLTADRPIPECLAKEQRVLNRDGSLRTIHPPTLTAEERAVVEARKRREAEARAAQQEAVRRDRTLMLRFPDEAAHAKARGDALDTVRLAITTSEKRLQSLAQERRPLLAEAEFYAGKPLPPKLQAALDGNEVATAAQQSAMLTQQAELERINRLYDAELDRLRQLWAGARPGSLGPMPGNGAAAR